MVGKAAAKTGSTGGRGTSGRMKAGVVSSHGKKFGELTFHDIARGLKPGIVRDIERSGIATREEIHRIIPARTLERRLGTGENLKLEEADAIARLLRTVERARETFGDDATADEWLRLANPALGGEVPLDMARSDLGAREVETVLGRIAHGVYS